MSQHESTNEYYKVAERPLALDTPLRTFHVGSDSSELQAIALVRRSLQRGLDHLSTLLDGFVLAQLPLAGTPKAFPNQYLIEVVFERVRHTAFHQRPSRSESVHLFQTRAAADAFNAHYRQNRGLIYRCRIAEGTPFETFMDWTNDPFTIRNPGAAIEALERRADAYWSGKPPEAAIYPEALVKGRVVVASGPLL